jgi:hypothetical protein
MLIQAKCGISSLKRLRDVLVELLKVSKAPSLVDPATSQYAARDWIDNIHPAIICPENWERVHQRYCLALLYYEMSVVNGLSANQTAYYLEGQEIYTVMLEIMHAQLKSVRGSLFWMRRMIVNGTGYLVGILTVMLSLIDISLWR